MRIAIDFDDTIFDRYSPLKRDIEIKTGRKIPEVADLQSVGLSKEAYRELVSIYENSRESIFNGHLVDGVGEAAIYLGERGHELAIVSCSYEERVGWIKEFLEKEGIGGYFSGFFGAIDVSKEEVCEEKALEVLVDNEPRHFTFQNPSLKRILFSPRIRVVGDKFEVAQSWKEVVKIINNDNN